MRKISYYLACASVNMHDLFPMVRDTIYDVQPHWQVACDWPKLAMEYQQKNAKFKTPQEELAARIAIRETEINAVLKSDVFVFALPISNGSMFEYGLACGAGQRVLVYSMSPKFIEGEAGHFMGLNGTMLVTGGLDSLKEAINRINTDLFGEYLKT